MPLSDTERDALRRMLERMPDSVLTATRETAERYLRDLEDTNSAMPETKSFLEARGLTNVRQLDKDGREALVMHLKNTLRLARN